MKRNRRHSEDHNAHRWLVVDDDPAVLELTREVLRSVPGSEVIACGDAHAALEVFFAEPESFELIVTDFNMPGLNGLELARAVHERAPDLKIVMVTGSDLDGASAWPGELEALLPKPYVPRALIYAVRSALAQTTSIASQGEGNSFATQPRPPAKEFVSRETSGGRGVNLCVVPFRWDLDKR